MSRTFAFSPCPNDTFAFHALVHGLVKGPDLTPRLEDIAVLNDLAEKGLPEIVKISVAAFGRVREEYALLRAGGAAGFGAGPVVVAAREREVGGRVAIPGENTTAALLLGLLEGDFETVSMRFDRIAPAVASGEVDCGVLIHEGRFTYAEQGLTLLCDLGEVWEANVQRPVPLGAIAVRRDQGQEFAARAAEAIRASVAYARKHPDASRDYVATHAQEMDPAVIRRHIDLYVNDYTLDLDEDAVFHLLRLGEQRGLFPASTAPVFA